MKKLLSLLSIFAIVLSCSSDETSTPVTPPIVKYTITLSAGQGGTVSTTGGEYEAGQTVNVTATPQGEYIFKEWSDGNTNATRTITVSSNSTLTANFEKRKYPLTVNIEGEGEVLEEIVNAGRTTDYDSGTTVKLTAVPSIAGWEFTGWTGAIASGDNPVQLLVTQVQSVTAVFNDNLKQSVLGKWDFNTASASGKGNQTANGNDCTILSIIFNSDMTFKMYVGNIVLLGDFSITNNTIYFKIEDESIGTISQISVDGTSLSATFNINNYCVSVNVAQKVEDYNNGKTYVPDDAFEQIMIDAGIDDVMDNYVSTDNVMMVKTLIQIRWGISVELTDGRQWNDTFPRDKYKHFTIETDEIWSNGRKFHEINPERKYDFIKNLAGIEDFANLTHIRILGYYLNEVDLSNNQNLEFVHFQYGKEIDFNLPNNLNYLRLQDFGFNNETIDLSKNHFQTVELDFRNDFPIKGHTTFATNVSGLSSNKLEFLSIIGHSLLNLNSVDLNQGLNKLDLSNNLLESLDLSSFENLERLYTQQNPNLNCINVSEQQLDSIPDSWYKDETASYRLNCDIETYVPDDNFEQALIDLGFDDVLDDYVLTANISGITVLNLDRKEISDLTGIESFESLESFNCVGNSLTSIDVFNNKSLKLLWLDNNSLTSIDLSENILLEKLALCSNNLTTIDISKNPNIDFLRLGNGCGYSGWTDPDPTTNNVTCVKVSQYQLDNNVSSLDATLSFALSCN